MIKKSLNKIFISPFIVDLINNSNLYCRQGCGIYLNDLCSKLKHDSKLDNEIASLILNENNFITEVILKINPETFDCPYIYECVVNLIKNMDFNQFFNARNKNKLYQTCLYKMLKILMNVSDKKIDGSLTEDKFKLNSLTIVNVIKVIGMLGQRIIENKITMENAYKINREYLINFVDDRNTNIRNICREASKIWKIIEDGEYRQNGGNENKSSDLNNSKNIFFSSMLSNAKKGKTSKIAERIDGIGEEVG